MESKRSFMTGEEKAFLKELVLQKCEIIECKKTDAISVARKKRAWVEVMAEFNSASENSCRTVDQLRKCFENMKSRRRKELTTEKVYRMSTGGGPYKTPSEDTVDNVFDNTLDIEIKDSIDSDTIVLNASNFDLDVPLAEVGECSEDMQIEIVGATPSTTVTPKPVPEKRTRPGYFSRGTAIEQELHQRLERTAVLQKQDEELHLLRISEQNLVIEERKVHLQIAEEILMQEKIKTKKLLDN